ncbi:MAG: AI-2E family transporter [Candidatus Baltobacteraceae bacterium]
MQTAVDQSARRRILLAAASIVLLALAMWFSARIPKTIAVFVVAAFVASAVHPVVTVLERRRIPRLWAITIVYVTLILLTVVVLVVVVPLTVEQVQALINNVPHYLQSAQAWLVGAQAALRQHFPELNIPRQPMDIQQLGGARITELLTLTVASLGTLALDVATGLFIAFSAIILSFFFLLNHESLADGFAGFFPPSKRRTARKLSSEAVGVFGGYIAGQVIVSGITGMLIAALAAMFGFKYALLIGLVSAIGYAIPIIGMLVVQLLALILAAPQGAFEIVTMQLIVFGVARISDNVLVPKIMGGAVGVSPIAVMFAVFAGGELFGLPGLILGIPAAAIARLLWRYFLGPWLHGQIDAVDEPSGQTHIVA